MVQRVAAATQRAEQVPIGQLEFGGGPILPGTQAAPVGGGGGAEVWLDGEQMGIVCRVKTDSGSETGGGPIWAAPGMGARTGVLGAETPHLLCWA